MHLPVCMSNEYIWYCMYVCVSGESNTEEMQMIRDANKQWKENTFGEEFWEKRRNRYAVRERWENERSETEVRRYKEYFKFQFHRELRPKVRSFTQERYSRLEEEEDDCRRGTQGLNVGLRKVSGESMRQREIVKISAAVRAHVSLQEPMGAYGSVVLLFMPSLRGRASNGNS